MFDELEVEGKEQAPYLRRLLLLFLIVTALVAGFYYEISKPGPECLPTGHVDCTPTNQY